MGRARRGTRQNSKVYKNIDGYMLEYVYHSLPTLIIFIAFLIRNESRITKIETTLDLHVKSHNLFLKTLGCSKDINK